jgi:hypothetical protein
MRPEVDRIVQLDPLPSENEASPERFSQFEQSYRAIGRPIPDDEARALVALVGDDGCFGLASSLVHLIETAPGWP